jgi:DNA topoisomerase-6 subunit B
VPLLYQQAACSTFKAVIDTKWNNYGLSQSRGALPSAPLLIMLHVASVWVPFTSESKEAIADYDEIRKEIKLAVQDCGRRLGLLLRRKKKKQAYEKRRDVFTRYIEEVVQATSSIHSINEEQLRNDLLRLARRYTSAADLEFDEHGQRVDHLAEEQLSNTVVVERSGGAPASEQAVLFTDGTPDRPSRKRGRKGSGQTKPMPVRR